MGTLSAAEECIHPSYEELMEHREAWQQADLEARSSCGRGLRPHVSLGMRGRRLNWGCEDSRPGRASLSCCSGLRLVGLARRKRTFWARIESRVDRVSMTRYSLSGQKRVLTYTWMKMDVLLNQAQKEIAATCRGDVTLRARQHLDPETNNLFVTRPPITFSTRNFAPSDTCTGFIERLPLESAVI
jgi:hypothetical protein